MQKVKWLPIIAGALSMIEPDWAEVKTRTSVTRNKPEFTPEELAYVRSLPKHERKAAVKALQEKYFNQKK